MLSFSVSFDIPIYRFASFVGGEPLLSFSGQFLQFSLIERTFVELLARCASIALDLWITTLWHFFQPNFIVCLSLLDIFLPIMPILLCSPKHFLLFCPEPPLYLLSLIGPFFIIILIYLNPIFQQFVPPLWTSLLHSTDTRCFFHVGIVILLIKPSFVILCDDFVFFLVEQFSKLFWIWWLWYMSRSSLIDFRRSDDLL